MTASNQVTGRAKVNAGELGELATEKGATFTEGGDKRNEKPADNGRTYFSKETESPALSIKVLSLPGISEKKIARHRGRHRAVRGRQRQTLDVGECIHQNRQIERRGRRLRRGNVL